MLRALHASSRPLWLLALALSVLFTGRDIPSAHAEPPPRAPVPNTEPRTPQPKYPLTLHADPILGRGAPSSNGWSTYLVQLTNSTGEVLAGMLHVTEARPPWAARKPTVERSMSQASFSVGAGQTAIVKMLVSGVRSQSVDIVAVGATGKTLGTVSTASGPVGQPLLVEIARTARVSAGLDQKTLGSPPTAGLPAPILSATIPHVDPKTGEFLLPDRAVSYAAATVVLAESENLLGLGERQLMALGEWVMAGGSLAIAITRPEDLHHRLLARWVGGVMAESNPSPQLASPAELVVPEAYPKLDSPLFAHQTVEAPAAQVAALRGYRGGNLAPSGWGSSSSYGLGEIHVLGFNPTREPFLGSNWIEAKLLQLVEHSASRRAFLANPFGTQDPSDWRYESIRRELDPNVGNHWVIVLSAFLLIAYAVVAGPINFQLASRRGRPLRALVHLPLWALGAFLLILISGAVAKGGNAKARRLTLAEVGAGMSRGAASRFRAFYTSSAEDLTVTVTEQQNALDVVDYQRDTQRSLSIERDGMRVFDVATRPWETLVVREDGFLTVGQGISMVPNGNDVQIKNRSGRDLLGVVVMRADGQSFFFERIRDRESVAAEHGERITRSTRTPGVATSLDSYTFATKIDSVTPGLSSALEAWNASSNDVDWWPPGVPTLLAQWSGGEGTLVDSGFQVESERVVLRVIGYGGEP